MPTNTSQLPSSIHTALPAFDPYPARRRRLRSSPSGSPQVTPSQAVALGLEEDGRSWGPSEGWRVWGGGGERLQGVEKVLVFLVCLFCCFNAGKAASRKARALGSGLSVFGKVHGCRRRREGREEGPLGEYLLVKSISPFGYEDGQFQSRLDYFVAFQIKRQFQSHEHAGDPREL